MCRLSLCMCMLQNHMILHYNHCPPYIQILLKEKKKKTIGYTVNLDCNMEAIASICFKSQLCSILQTKECPKIQKAVGNPTAHIFRLTSCPKLGKIKQNIIKKHATSVKNEENWTSLKSCFIV